MISWVANTFFKTNLLKTIPTPNLQKIRETSSLCISIPTICQITRVKYWGSLWFLFLLLFSLKFICNFVDFTYNHILVSLNVCILSGREYGAEVRGLFTGSELCSCFSRSIWDLSSVTYGFLNLHSIICNTGTKMGHISWSCCEINQVWALFKKFFVCLFK